ncbi:hypothetical protein LOAG_00935 [Loa loa]|uniref:Uncharacterized protein n=1 Tax=Loa loa TaxID=7209 RepID=A0A1S0UA22_LOALO|nr:hypothetical protein LOAG_00935 [Loa loa]EFO27555.1 hypothetical protein LOAG_00935 [Loa loa]
MENLDYKDVLESSLRKSIKSTLSPSSSLSSNNEYQQLLTTNYTTTKDVLNSNVHFHATNERKKQKLSDDIFMTNAIYPDQMLHETQRNITKIASSNLINFKIILFLKLFSTFCA